MAYTREPGRARHMLHIGSGFRIDKGTLNGRLFYPPARPPFRPRPYHALYAQPYCSATWQFSPTMVPSLHSAISKAGKHRYAARPFPPLYWLPSAARSPLLPGRHLYQGLAISLASPSGDHLINKPGQAHRRTSAGRLYGALSPGRRLALGAYQLASGLIPSP